MSAGEAPIRVRVHYDFASSLCYVAHRVVPRLRDELETLGIEISWTPLDLARLLRWRRGGEIPPDRAENVARVSRELEVPLRMPPFWLDSRRAMAAALCLKDPAVEATFRERVFTAVFEEGRFDALGTAPESLCQELGWSLEPARIEAALDELGERTEAAREAQVSGVPTFMLGPWPFGGIQSEETLTSFFRRFAARERLRSAKDIA
ncbi:MAG: DsbA family protein [Myxococcota bacterium]|jgi:predicted DsbA family dithiol-disulfide isomerase